MNTITTSTLPECVIPKTIELKIIYYVRFNYDNIVQRNNAPFFPVFLLAPTDYNGYMFRVGDEIFIYKKCTQSYYRLDRTIWVWEKYEFLVSWQILNAQISSDGKSIDPIVNNIGTKKSIIKKSE